MIAFIMAVCVLGMPVSPSLVFSQPIGFSPEHVLLNDLTAIKLPESIGKIEEIYRGSKPKIVLLIQDAHAIGSAQRSIEKIIQYFQTEYGVYLVGLEGASSRLDAQFFRSFPDQAKLRKIFDNYYDKGELNGTTAAAVFSSEKGIFHGVEDWSLYEEGVNSYLKALEDNVLLQPKFDQLRNSLDEDKKRVYSQVLLEADELLESFEENKSDLMLVLHKMNEVYPLDQESQLFLLLDAWNKEKFQKISIQGEVRKAAESVQMKFRTLAMTQRLREDIQKFNTGFQQFQTSRISAQEFALYLNELITKYDFKIPFSDLLQKETTQRKFLRDLQGDSLLREFENYAIRVLSSLAVSPEEKELIRRSRKLFLISKFMHLELSLEDWKEMRAWSNPEQPSLASHSEVFIDEEMIQLIQQMKNHAQFYDIAQKRDQVFLREMGKLMSQYQASSAMMVAGGFHSEQMMEKFKNAGISYALIMPNIPTLPEQDEYSQAMRGEVSWKSYFQIEDDKINLRDAFARAARDRLLKDSQQTDNAIALIKLWRDQIIRDLSEQGNLNQSTDYTRFLDELAQDESFTEDVLGGWIENIRQFFQKVRELEDEGRLSRQAISELIQTSTTIPEVLNVLSPDLASGYNLPYFRQELRGRSLSYLLPLVILVASNFFTPIQAAPNEVKTRPPMTAVEISPGRMVMFPGNLNETQKRQARAHYLKEERDRIARKAIPPKAPAPAAQKKASAPAKINVSTNLIVRNSKPSKPAEYIRIVKEVDVAPSPAKQPQPSDVIVVSKGTEPVKSKPIELTITGYSQRAKDALRMDPKSIKDPNIRHFYQVWQWFDEGYQKYGFQLFGNQYQDAVMALQIGYLDQKLRGELSAAIMGDDMNSQRFGSGYHESMFQAVQQLGGPAMSFEMIEPAPVMDTIYYALAGKNQARKDVLLKGVSEAQRQAVMQIYEQRKANGKVGPLKETIRTLMKDKDMVHRIMNLYIDMRIKRFDFMIPSYDNPELMMKVYAWVWYPGQFFQGRIMDSMHLAKSFMIYTKEASQNPEAAAKEFLTNYQFVRDLDRVYAVLQSSKNAIRGKQADWKAGRQQLERAKRIYQVVLDNQRVGAYKTILNSDQLIEWAKGELEAFEKDFNQNKVPGSERPNKDLTRGEIAESAGDRVQRWLVSNGYARPELRLQQVFAQVLFALAPQPIRPELRKSFGDTADDAIGDLPIIELTQDMGSSLEGVLLPSIMDSIEQRQSYLGQVRQSLFESLNQIQSLNLSVGTIFPPDLNSFSQVFIREWEKIFSSPAGGRINEFMYQGNFPAEKRIEWKEKYFESKFLRPFRLNSPVLLVNDGQQKAPVVNTGEIMGQAHAAYWLVQSEAPEGNDPLEIDLMSFLKIVTALHVADLLQNPDYQAKPELLEAALLGRLSFADEKFRNVIEFSKSGSGIVFKSQMVRLMVTIQAQQAAAQAA